MAEGPTPANRAGFRFGYNEVLGWRLGKIYSGGPAVALQGSVAPSLARLGGREFRFRASISSCLTLSGSSASLLVPFPLCSALVRRSCWVWVAHVAEGSEF